jgi:hypothetical protein
MHQGVESDVAGMGPGGNGGSQESPHETAPLSGNVPYVKHDRLVMKTSSVLPDKWLREKIAPDPGLLGLGV